MYNLYIHEKQLSNFEKASNDKKKIIEFETKRRRKINKLTKNYNNRMKNFVLNLCENPVILGQNEENENLTYNNRFDNNENESKNYLVFGNYISDKKKIELINEEKLLLKKYDEINKESQRKRDLLNAKKNSNLILLQPRMKFGPREEIENIVDSINKNGSFNINKKYTKILNDHLKKLKDNNVRYIKGYDILKNNFGNNYDNIKKTILKDEYQENEYSHKNVIASKLSNNMTNLNRKDKILEYKDPSNKDDKSGDSKTFKKTNFGNKYNNIIKSNELKRLFNDNRKIYFKGASQFISLKLVKPDKKKQLLNSVDDIQDQDISVIYTDKNIYFKKGNKITKEKSNDEKKLNKQKSMPEPNNNKKPKINMNIFTPTNQNENHNQSYLNKYIDLDIPSKFKKNNTPLNRIAEDNYENNIQGLCEESKLKKIKMNSLMNKEINKSIVSNYMDKYDIINEFNKNNTINTNSLYFQGYNSNIAEKPYKNLNEKLKYLIKVIQKRNRELIKENMKENSYLTVTGHLKSLNKKEKKNVKKVASNDYILIDGQFISKRDIKTLSDVIFTKCHFYKKKKSQSQRNIMNHNDKMGKGRGLTVNNFYSKIGIN